MLGRYREALAALDTLGPSPPALSRAGVARVWILLFQGRFTQSGKTLDALSAGERRSDEAVRLAWYLARFNRDPQGMLRALEGVPAFLGDEVTSLLRADAYFLLHENAKAKAAAAEARRAIEDAPRTGLLRAKSRLELMDGHREAALALADRFVADTPITADATNGPDALYNRAVIEVQAGRTAAALSDLETLVDSQHGTTFSAATLKADPDWDPVRQDPRFVAAVEKFALREN
jgi:tetratricopeptide (TPR) repeat protein